MKTILAFGLLLASFTASAVPLQPLDIKSRSCQAVVNDVTYETNAVCWKNQDGELRMYFKDVDFAAIRETGINTRNIINVNEACATTNEYTYADLLGDTPRLTAEQIEAKPVKIVVSQLDASACFRTR